MLCQAYCAKFYKYVLVFYLPSKNRWAEKQDQMFDAGAIGRKTDVSKMYTDKFVPK